jgi:uncharacterized protein YbjT (DUF2867 family)
MKYVITGSLGHISKPLSQRLVQSGHEVAVLTSNSDRVAAIEAIGAKAAVGSVEDAAFLVSGFAGANAVYLMIPPRFDVSDWIAYQQQVADNYIAAIKANGIQHVVVLSSIGAHLGKGAGPVDGLAYLENQLRQLPGIHALFLRPSYFYYNLFGMIPLIKGMGIMGGNYGDTDEKLVLVDTNDIADVAYEALNSLHFTGTTVQYIASDERHPNEIATVLSEAIGRPGIPWMVVSDEQARQGMLASGMPETIADGYTTLGAAIRSGIMQEDYWSNRPVALGKVKLEDFAKAFAGAYQAG